jgi:hypothetical protein
MNKSITIIFAIAALLTANMAMAQPVKPVKPAVKPATTLKFKPPKVKTAWGRCVDSIGITKEEAAQLISIPLRIIDAQNKTYAIASYQVAYTRVTVTEDEASGKVLPATEMVSDRFTTTPLPQLWQDNIKTRLQRGEKFYFFDVIVRDAQGRLFFAPNLKVTIL